MRLREALRERVLVLERVRDAVRLRVAVLERVRVPLLERARCGRS